MPVNPQIGISMNDPKKPYGLDEVDRTMRKLIAVPKEELTELERREAAAKKRRKKRGKRA